MSEKTGGSGDQTSPLFRLDALRLFASAGVVLFHMHFFGDGPLSNLGNHPGFALLVDLFFVISGVVIGHAYGGRVVDVASAWAFLSRRIARLAPLHWLTAALFLAVNLAAMAWLPVLEIRGREVACLVPNVAMLHSLGACRALSLNWPSWSISAELAMYLSFSLVCLAVPRRMLPWAAMAIIAAGALTMALADWSPRPWYKWTYDGGALRAVPSFFLGVLMEAGREHLRRLPSPRHAHLLLFALYGAAAVMDVAAPVLIALLYLTVLLAYAEDLRRPADAITRRLAGLSELTYPLYLWHSPVFMIVVSVVGVGLLGAGPDGQDVALAIALFLLPLIAHLSARRFEQPLKAWLASRLGPSGRGGGQPEPTRAA